MRRRTGATSSPRSATPAHGGSGSTGAALPLRAMRRGEGLPALAGAVAFAVGLVNLLSALTPNVAWRHHALLQLEPVEAVPLFHTLAVPVERHPRRDPRSRCGPAGAAPGRRRSRSWLVLGLLELLKGLDFEEAILSWAAGSAALVGPGRVPRAPRAPASALAGHRSRSLALGGVCSLAAIGDLGGDAGGADRRRARAGQPALLDDGARWRSTTSSRGCRSSLGAFGLAVDRAADRTSSSGRSALRGRRRGRTRGRGPPTSSGLTGTTRSRSSSSAATRTTTSRPTGARSSATASRTACSLISGDPVGEPGRDSRPRPGHLRLRRGAGPARGGARRRADLLPVYREAGLRVALRRRRGDRRDGRFSLEGRAIRKVRQSVSRLEAAGLLGRGDRLRASSTRRRSRARARVRALAGRARRSAASRWRWTRCAASTSADSVVVAARDAGRHDPRLPALRARATGARRCRCRSCAATGRRRTA